MPFNLDALIQTLPYLLGSNDMGAVMEGKRRADEKRRQAQLDQERAAYQDAQMGNLAADNRRQEETAALNRLTSFYRVAPQMAEQASATATDPVQANLGLAKQLTGAAQSFGVDPAQALPFVPNMTEVVSGRKKKRAQELYTQLEKTYGPEAMANDTITAKSEEFGDVKPSQLRAMFAPPAVTAQGAPAAPYVKPTTPSDGASDLDRSFNREKAAREKKLGRPLTETEIADLDRSVRQSVRSITAPGPRPVSRAQKFTMTRALQNDWRKIAAPAMEINRQLSIMRNGMDAMRRGDMGAATEAVVVTFEKILDPNSVVREAEFWRAANGQSLLRRVETAYQRVKAGGYVTPETMEQFMRLAEEVAGATAAQVEPYKKQIEDTAIEFEIDPGQVLTDVNPPESSIKAAPSGSGQPAGVEYDYVPGKGLVPRKAR